MDSYVVSAINPLFGDNVDNKSNKKNREHGHRQPHLPAFPFSLSGEEGEVWFKRCPALVLVFAGDGYAPTVFGLSQALFLLVPLELMAR